MIQHNTTIRALVPISPAKKKFIDILKHVYKFFSLKLYSLFAKRKKHYISFLIIFSFGALLGSYFYDLHIVTLPIVSNLRLFRILLIICFFSGVTIFGIVIVPLAGVVTSFMCSLLISGYHLKTTQDILFFGLFALFVFFLLVFLSEAFDTALRSLNGFKSLFYSKIFLLYIFQFAISYILIYFLLS